MFENKKIPAAKIVDEEIDGISDDIFQMYRRLYNSGHDYISGKAIIIHFLYGRP
jgi:hypothetical protein